MKVCHDTWQTGSMVDRGGVKVGGGLHGFLNHNTTSEVRHRFAESAQAAEAVSQARQ